MQNIMTGLVTIVRDQQKVTNQRYLASHLALSVHTMILIPLHHSLSVYFLYRALNYSDCQVLHT